MREYTTHKHGRVAVAAAPVASGTRRLPDRAHTLDAVARLLAVSCTWCCASCVAVPAPPCVQLGHCHAKVGLRG